MSKGSRVATDSAAGVALRMGAAELHLFSQRIL